MTHDAEEGAAPATARLTTHIKVPVTEEMREQFKYACWIDRTNMAEVVRADIQAYIDQDRPKP